MRRMTGELSDTVLHTKSELLELFVPEVFCHDSQHIDKTKRLVPEAFEIEQLRFEDHLIYTTLVAQTY